MNTICKIVRQTMKTIRTAEILCVGTELLLGDIINTNAAFLSRRLAAMGISVYYQSVIGDHPGRLRAALEIAMAAFQRAVYVFAAMGASSSAEPPSA